LIFQRSQCFCGDSYGLYGTVSETSCSHKCAGDLSQICGGSAANSIYEIVPWKNDELNELIWRLRTLRLLKTLIFRKINKRSKFKLINKVSQMTNLGFTHTILKKGIMTLAQKKYTFWDKQHLRNSTFKNFNLIIKFRTLNYFLRSWL